MSDVGNIAWPGTPNPKTPTQFIKTVAASGTPEVLHASRSVKSLQFNPDKGLGVANTGSITIQILTEAGAWVDYKTLANDDPPLDWTAPDERMFNLANFRIKVATNGDGVRIVYDR